MAMRDESIGGESPKLRPDKFAVTPGRIVVGVLVLAFVWWCFTNRQSVNVTFLFTDRDIPLFMVLLIAFAVGLAAGALLWSRRTSRKARAAKR